MHDEDIVSRRCRMLPEQELSAVPAMMSWKALLSNY